MSFGKRGIVASSNELAPRSRAKQNFTPTSSKELKLLRAWDFGLAAIWPKGEILPGIAYPLSCLALGLVLGGAVGATLAPQLLHAEDAGVYNFIHMNDTMMRGRVQRPVAQPRAALPELSFRRQRGRPGVVQARLPAERYSVVHRHIAGRNGPEVAKPMPEIGPQRGECRSCELARYSSPLDAILNDKSLRPGDTVMMSMGAVVFRGADHLPYTAADFTDFRQAKLLTKKERLLIDADLGLSLRANAMRGFDRKALAASQISPTVAKAGEMRAFLAVPTESR